MSELPWLQAEYKGHCVEVTLAEPTGRLVRVEITMEEARDAASQLLGATGWVPPFLRPTPEESSAIAEVLRTQDQQEKQQIANRALLKMGDVQMVPRDWPASRYRK